MMNDLPKDHPIFKRGFMVGAYLFGRSSNNPKKAVLTPEDKAPTPDSKVEAEPTSKRD